MLAAVAVLAQKRRRSDDELDALSGMVVVPDIAVVETGNEQHRDE